MTHFAYFPGCALKGTTPEYDQSAQIVSRALGIELKEIPDWNCCGAAPAHSVNSLLAAALPARNLVLAGKMGLDVVAPCPACFGRLKYVSKRCQEETQFRDLVNQTLDEPYTGGIGVKSLLQVFSETVDPQNLSSLVKHPLAGMKIAPYYGCLTVRPAEITEFDDAENPTSMDKLLRICGAEIVDFPFKTECCGAAYALARREVVIRLSGTILDLAIAQGANAIAVACPLCHQNLDLRQGQIEVTRRQKFGIPIYYFTQLIGLALGFSVKDMGIDRHAVDATRLVSGLVEPRT